MIVHLCLWTSGHEASSSLTGFDPQWAVMPRIIIVINYNFFFFSRIGCGGKQGVQEMLCVMELTLTGTGISIGWVTLYYVEIKTRRTPR